MTTLHRLVEFASDFIEQHFAKAGEIKPLFHCVKRNGDHFVVPALINDKDGMSHAIRAICEKYDVTQVMFIDEAWRAEANTPEDMRELEAWLDTHDGHLEGFPKRIECVVISAEDENGQMLSGARQIRRDGDKATLGPLEIDWQPTHSEGRFVGLIPGRGKAN